MSATRDGSSAVRGNLLGRVHATPNLRHSRSMSRQTYSVFHGCIRKGDVDQPNDLKIGPSRKGRHSIVAPNQAAVCSMRMTLK